jgi:putative NIF3 family GTP cyclohydrolase 1 type 2
MRAIFRLTCTLNSDITSSWRKCWGCRPAGISLNITVDLGIAGEIPEGRSPAKIAEILEKELQTKCVLFGKHDKPVRKIGIISGGGGRPEGIIEAARQGIECFITGETNHTSYHFIREENISVIIAGHYATEKPGVIAVMDRIREKFAVDCEFIDIPTGL